MKTLIPVVALGLLVSCGKPPTEKEAKIIAEKRLNTFLVERYHDAGNIQKPILKSVIFNNEMWSYGYNIGIGDKSIGVVVIVDKKSNAEISIEEGTKQ